MPINRVLSLFLKPWVRMPGRRHPDSGQSSLGREVSVFLSYAREDGLFVHALRRELIARGVLPKGDWQLVPGPDYQEQLNGLILSSDAFAPVISPHSIDSAACRAEISFADEAGKRFLPVLYRNGETERLAAVVRTPQWTLIHDVALGAEQIALFVESVRSDPALVELHTILGQRSADWIQHGRDRSLLLRGRALTAAEKWLAAADQLVCPVPTPTANQRELIDQSRRRQRLVARRIQASVLLVTACSLLSVAYTRTERFQLGVIEANAPLSGGGPYAGFYVGRLASIDPESAGRIARTLSEPDRCPAWTTVALSAPIVPGEGTSWLSRAEAEADRLVPKGQVRCWSELVSALQMSGRHDSAVAVLRRAEVAAGPFGDLLVDSWLSIGERREGLRLARHLSDPRQLAKVALAFAVTEPEASFAIAAESEALLNARASALPLDLTVEMLVKTWAIGRQASDVDRVLNASKPRLQGLPVGLARDGAAVGWRALVEQRWVGEAWARLIDREPAERLIGALQPMTFVDLKTITLLSLAEKALASHPSATEGLLRAAELAGDAQAVTTDGLFFRLAQLWARTGQFSEAIRVVMRMNAANQQSMAFLRLALIAHASGAKEAGELLRRGLGGVGKTPLLPELESEVKAWASVALARFGRLREARIMADECSVSSHRIVGYAAILTAYAAKHTPDSHVSRGWDDGEVLANWPVLVPQILR